MTAPINPSLRTPIVFISSQIGVFAKERKELAKLIKDKLKWQACLFEDLSRPFPSRKVYKSAIEQSHIFVGIYGTEYGWIDTQNGMEISGLHDEWRLAKEYKKTTFAFVLNTKDNRDPRLTNLISNEVNTDSTSTSFDGPEDLYQKVIDSLYRFQHDCTIAATEDDSLELPNYSELLRERYQSHVIIETSFVEQKLYPAVRTNKKVFLYGKPGIGKTIALMLLCKKEPTVYISLRNRSLLYVLGYLANRILQSLGRTPRAYTSTDDALVKCEQLLRTNGVLVAIDDTDQNQEIARCLLGLEIGNSRIIFAGRKYIPDGDMIGIECTGFFTIL